MARARWRSAAKRLGIYRERTWRDYASMVARTAKALAADGLRAGDRVAIMADVCEEWLICDQAVQSLGAIVYGIYPTASAQEVEYQMRDGGAVLFVAEDQEYVDRILPLVDRLPALRRIVVIDDTALFAFSHDKVVAYDELCEAGRDADLTWLEGEVRKVRPSNPRSSSTPPAPRGIPRACWSPTASISRQLVPSRRSTPRSSRSRTGPSPTCRSAMCWDATSPSRCL